MREIVTMRLGGADHPLRPTWGAYGAIEARCGSLFLLWQKVSLGQATLQELAIIVTEGMKAAGSADGRKIDETSVSKRLFEEGPWSDEVKAAIGDYLESLGWTPEQRKKIAAKVTEMQAASMEALAGYSPTPQPSTA